MFANLDKPSPPRNLHATETDSSYILLAWDLPETDGGSPIIGYNIEKRDSKRDEFVYVASVDATALHFKVTRLFEGNEYYFRIFAENQVGSSLPCEMERSVKAKPPCGKTFRIIKKLYNSHFLVLSCVVFIISGLSNKI